MKLTSNYIEIDVVFTLPNSSHVHRLAHFKFQQLDYTTDTTTFPLEWNHALMQPQFHLNDTEFSAMESRIHVATIHLNYTEFSATIVSIHGYISIDFAIKKFRH